MGVHCSSRDSRKTLEHWQVCAGVKGKNLQVNLRGPDEKKLAHAAALLDNLIHHWIVCQPAYEGEHNTATAHKRFWDAVIHSIKDMASSQTSAASSSTAVEPAPATAAAPTPEPAPAATPTAATTAGEPEPETAVAAAATTDAEPAPTAAAGAETATAETTDADPAPAAEPAPATAPTGATAAPAAAPTDAEPAPSGQMDSELEPVVAQSPLPLNLAATLAAQAAEADAATIDILAAEFATVANPKKARHEEQDDDNEAPLPKRMPQRKQVFLALNKWGGWAR